MLNEFKRLLIGNPIPTEHQIHERLDKKIALAVFSSDALSSVAYATEAILAVLILAGTASLHMALPIGVLIALLLLVVGFSYRQTIHAYPNGGGAYIVARENLGIMPSLVAAAALLTDYVLTVAVSISAGVAAIVSLASAWGIGNLGNYAVEIALGAIVLVTLVNLRGVKESGTIFAVPTYVFVLSIIALIGVGVSKAFLGAPGIVNHPVPAEVGVAGGSLTIWLFLRAFAAGCTALTGVEAISNGVPAFKPPESRNAATTLTWMIGILTIMFLGITWIANHYGITPNEMTHETVVSQIARTVFGTGPIYTLIQVATALILLLAANTSFADFPRLASLLGHDRFLPRQFTNRGDRLVFSNGIVILGFLAMVLVVIFRANEIAMLPLYAIGVFISFTLSQSGMVLHHLRLKEPGWRYGLAINALGTVLTTVVLIVLAITKFTHGAWAVLVLLPLLVVIFQSIHQHYRRVAAQLSLDKVTRPKPINRLTAIVLVGGIHRGTLPALAFAQSVAPGNATAVYVDVDTVQTAKLRTRWDEWCSGIPLVVLPSPYRSIVEPILAYIEAVNPRRGNTMLMVIIPEFVPAHWWEHVLHNQSGLWLQTILRLRKGTVVVSVPYRLKE